MDIYMNEEATARMADMDKRREEGEMKGIEVPEMKDTRTMSPSSNTCDPFYSTSAASSPARSFQAEDSLGTKDPATGMILIEYDYLPSSSGHRARAPPSLSPARESPRAPSSSRSESYSWEFSPAPDGRMRTRSKRERVTRFNLHIQGVEFLVRVETGNISRSRIEVSGAFLRGVIVPDMPRHNTIWPSIHKI